MLRKCTMVCHEKSDCHHKTTGILTRKQHFSSVYFSIYTYKKNVSYFSYIFISFHSWRSLDCYKEAMVECVIISAMCSRLMDASSLYIFRSDRRYHKLKWIQIILFPFYPMANYIDNRVFYIVYFYVDILIE